jgi:hypothetical protein
MQTLLGPQLVVPKKGMDGLFGTRVAEPRLTPKGLPSVWPHNEQMLYCDALGALPVLECFLLVQAHRYR